MVKPLELSPFQVKTLPRPFCPDHALFQKELNSKNETRFGLFELSPGLNLRFDKIVFARVKPRLLKYVNECIIKLSNVQYKNSQTTDRNFSRKELINR